MPRVGDEPVRSDVGSATASTGRQGPMAQELLELRSRAAAETTTAAAAGDKGACERACARAGAADEDEEDEDVGDCCWPWPKVCERNWATEESEMARTEGGGEGAMPSPEPSELLRTTMFCIGNMPGGTEMPGPITPGPACHGRPPPWACSICICARP